MDFIQYIQNFSLFRIHRVGGGGGFVCIDISSCYQNLAALMLIFTSLSTLLKYIVVTALCTLSCLCSYSGGSNSGEIMLEFLLPASLNLSSTPLSFQRIPFGILLPLKFHVTRSLMRVGTPCSYCGRFSGSALLKRINCVQYRSPVMVSFGFNSS